MTVCLHPRQLEPVRSLRPERSLLWKRLPSYVFSWQRIVEHRPHVPPSRERHCGAVLTTANLYWLLISNYTSSIAIPISVIILIMNTLAMHTKRGEIKKNWCAALRQLWSCSSRLPHVLSLHSTPWYGTPCVFVLWNHSSPFSIFCSVLRTIEYVLKC